MTVNIVDDDLSLTKALTMLFESEGYQVKSFASADEFFQQIEHQRLSAGCLTLICVCQACQALNFISD